MRFLVDNQLPVALARFLAANGSDALHVSDVGLAAAPDTEIWRYAAGNGCILISKDEDFFHRAVRPDAPVQLVWIRLGNCRKPELLAAVERTWQKVCNCLQAGERIVELR